MKLARSVGEGTLCCSAYSSVLQTSGSGFESDQFVDYFLCEFPVSRESQV